MTHITSGTALIWIDQWEYQCCGSPISTGDVVDLTVHGTDWPQPWTTALGAPVQLAAEHHVPPPSSYHLRVRVDRLLEARAHREQHPGDEGWYLVPRSGEVQEIGAMRVWDEDWQPARQGGEPVGWILDVTVLHELPPRRDNTPYGVDLTPRLIRPDETNLPRLQLSKSSLSSGPEADPKAGLALQTPLLAAWQPEASTSIPDGFVLGHPCILTRADTTGCTCLFVGHGGLHNPHWVGNADDFVPLTPGQFLGRVVRLLSSDWPGFSNVTLAGKLEDHAALFPDGIPPYVPE